MGKLSTNLVKIPHLFIKLIPDIHKRIVIPDHKIPAARKLFRHKTGHYLNRGAVLVAVISVIVALLYFWPTRTNTVTTQSAPAAPVPTEQKPQAAEYHAVIEKKLDGVVITIQGPEHEKIFTKLPPGYHPVVQDDKIVHVVTRGNTLWFIAKRYIKNPYRYPELVRLNKIKNPDLIYPGDRVIIQHIRKPNS